VKGVKNHQEMGPIGRIILTKKKTAKGDKKSLLGFGHHFLGPQWGRAWGCQLKIRGAVVWS